MQCPFIKASLLSYGSGFFLKGRYSYAFIILKNEKNTFFNEISSKKF